jgi:hypothetical protein
MDDWKVIKIQLIVYKRMSIRNNESRKEENIILNILLGKVV